MTGATARSHSPAARRRPWPLWLVAVVLFALSTVIAPHATADDDPPAAGPEGVTSLDALERAFQSVVERVAPSVVGIRALRRHPNIFPGLGREGTGEANEQQLVINGSGTIVSDDGLILTNEHVVQGTSSIDVHFHDGRSRRATILAADPRSDLAVLHVPCSGLQPVTFCDWSSVTRGQWAIVLGNPFGLGADGHLSVSVGIVANLGRQLPGLGAVDDRFYSNMIQITAPINPGNSGGPLFNVHGELIGIVTAMHTRAPADEGIGFAIPLTPAKRRVIETLCRGQTVAYGYLGATVRQPDRAERDALTVSHGVIIQRLEPDGPAQQAGLQVGDAIREYDHQPITGPGHLAELVGQSTVGATVRLDVLRDGRPLVQHAIIEQRDINRVSWMRGGAISWRGMRLADLTPDARQRMRVDGEAAGVVVIGVDEDTPARRANLRVGDVIARVGGSPVADTLDFLLRVRDVKGTLELSLHNEGPRFISP